MLPRIPVGRAAWIYPKPGETSSGSSYPPKRSNAPRIQGPDKVMIAMEPGCRSSLHWHPTRSVGRTLHNLPVRCNRFREDGSPCRNCTPNADGWCRQDGCPGFVRRDPTSAPITEGGPEGTSRHIAETGGIELTGVAIDDVPAVHVTTHALDSFRFHHGGNTREAAIQLRMMLEDFLVKSSRRISHDGYIRLARDGYVLTLSPAGHTITGYKTVHRERTWEQFKAGVKSRFKSSGKARKASGPVPEPGPKVSLADFQRRFEPDAVYLTGRVRTCFAKIADLRWASEEELDAQIRAACAHFESGKVTHREDGCFEVEVADRIWLLTPDCLKLVGVRTSSSR